MGAQGSRSPLGHPARPPLPPRQRAAPRPAPPPYPAQPHGTVVGTLGRAGSSTHSPAGAVAGGPGPRPPDGSQAEEGVGSWGARVGKARGTGRLLLYWGRDLAYGPGPHHGHPSEWRRRPDSSPHTDGPGSSAPAGPAGSPGERLHPRPAYLCPSRCPPEVPAWGTARFTALPLPIQAPSVLGHPSRLTPLGPVCSWVTEMASCPCPSLFPWADGPPGTAQALRGLVSQETLDWPPSEP